MAISAEKLFQRENKWVSVHFLENDVIFEKFVIKQV